MGGDGNRICARPDHKVRSTKAALKQVGFYGDQAATALSQGIGNIAPRLNQRFHIFTE